MATTYEGIPELAERLTGADLVLIGRVEKLADVEMHTVEEELEVHSLFTVSVERVLEGELDLDEITVRVIGGSAENVQTSWTVELREGERILFLLASDVGPGRPSSAYVPYFAGCYRVTDEVAALPEGRTTLTKVRSLLTSKRRAQRRELATLEKLEPANLRRRPYQPVAEMPEELRGGAEDAKPDDGPDEQTPSGRRSRRSGSSSAG